MAGGKAVFEVVSEPRGLPGRLVSRHRKRGRADYAIKRVTLKPGEAVSLYERERLVLSRYCHHPDDPCDIPF